MAKSALPTAEMNAALASLRAQAPAVRDRALVLAAAELTGEAQFDAPVATGFLKASHNWDAPKRGAIRLGATAEYAAAVHARHPTRAGWFAEVMANRAAAVLAGALKIALRPDGGRRR